MTSLLRFCILSQLIFCSFALAQGENGSTPFKNVKPNQVCVGAMAGFLQYQRFMQSLNATGDVLGNFRDFRASLSTATLTPKSTDFSANSQNASGAAKKKIAQQIDGINKDYYAPQGKDLSKENIVAGIRLDGRAQIENFYRDITQLIQQVNAIARTHQVATIVPRVQNVFAGITLSGLMGAAAGLFDQNLLWIFAAGGLKVAHSNDIYGLMAYFSKDAKTFIKSLETLQTFLDTASAGDWIYDSFSGNPTENLVNTLRASTIDMAELQIRQQDIFDSQGYFKRRGRNEIQKKNAKTAWVGFDRLVQMNAEGQPVMQIVMRTQNHRPKYPQKVPAKTPPIASPQLVPVYVTP